MLGAMAGHLPFRADVLREAVLARFARRKPHLLEANRLAFAAGQHAVGAECAADAA
jgi:indolepyruvate ferredoxin oxidoreductase beta subunit